MTPSEAALVLAKAQAFDNRTVGPVNITAWADALADVDYEAASDAVTDHYRTNTAWIMPGHIVALIAQQREYHRALLKAAGYPDFPNGLTPSEERAYRQAWQAEIKRGATRQEATAAADAVFDIVRGELVAAPREFRAQLEQLAQSKDVR